MDVGSKRLNGIPVSPFTPFSVTRIVLAAGIMIVAPVANAGGVIVLLPVVRTASLT
jgi:hypothetical protein